MINNLDIDFNNGNIKYINDLSVNMVALLYKNKSKMSNKKYSRLVGDINKTVKEKDMLSFIKIGKRLLAM